MTWFFFALLACVASCTSMEIVRKSRLDGFEVLLYRAMIVGFMLLPFLTYMSWPTDPRFYLLMAISSFVYAWGNIVVTNLARHKNGRVAMMIQPLAIFTTFLVWIAVNPADRITLTTDRQGLSLTLLCFAGLFTALHFIRRNDYAWSAFIAVAPVAIGYALLNVAQKWFIGGHDGGWGMILAIIMLGNFGMVAALPFLKKYRVASCELSITHRARFPVALLFGVAILHIINWGSIMHAMNVASNPAYPVAIMALSPVIFQLYYWVRGWQDNASPIAGAAMTASALFLGLIHI